MDSNLPLEQCIVQCYAVCLVVGRKARPAGKMHETYVM